ncbi:hypothetical protein O7599_25930 [Streptomyces sp. WMMC500]|uniref:hypothetical protein n=1 Tax=Streptomyces sp. WMMC500 TaxID=3015154 RepID=UPI00248BA51B|nr:hypothetical protein [Streptomyces sp. WMMC500]WBB59022.1 hypothetical protein O7599_25930 [Streptomyces sp. WMMC500]
MSGDESVAPVLAAAYDAHDAAGVVAALGELAGRLDLARLPALWHPLGFFRLEVARDHAGRGYFLHCWPRGERRPHEPALAVHRHAYALESLVIDGELRNRRFDSATTAPSSLRGPLYRAERAGRQSALKRTENVAELDELEDLSLGPGCFYGVSPEEFHESRVDVSRFCVTLARMSRRVRPNPHVLGDFASPPVLLYRHTPVAQSLLIQLADHLRALDDAGPPR